MNLALISPIPDLGRFDRECTVHLVLAQLCRIGPYRKYYQRRSDRGDYVILDNGADELGRGMRIQELLDIAAWIGAHEVVMPDVQQDGAATVAATREACEWLLTHDGRDAYAKAGHPRLMIVPQGETFTEWMDCYAALWNMRIYQGRVWNDNYEPVIGIAKNHEAVLPGGILSLLEGIPTAGLDVHLLGWPKRLEAVTECVERYPNIRSIDTARPLVYAGHQQTVIPFDRTPAWPGRPDDYFDRGLLPAYHNIARSNVNAFRIMAKESDDARLRA